MEYCSGRGDQLDKWISRRLAAEKRFGKNDRAWYSDKLFAAARFGITALSISEIVQQGLQVEPQNIIDAAKTLSGWDSFSSRMKRCSPELFWDAVRMCMGEIHESNAESKEALRVLSESASVEARILLSGIPVWCGSHFEDRVTASKWTDEDRINFIDNQKSRPPLWVRCNHTQQIEQFYNECRSKGLSFREHEGAIALYGHTPVYTLDSYNNGLIEVQDFASQKIGASCAVLPGHFVWDACAGGGGKTMQIASALMGKGAVYASDIRTYKLDEVRRRARRAQFSNVRTIDWNGSGLPEFPREITLRGGFDIVLADAPCSASGTWRRNPDGRIRTTPKDILELSEIQGKILGVLADSVKKGGALVYATCSFFAEENERVVERFLAHNLFTLESMTINGSPYADSDTTFNAVFRK